MDTVQGVQSERPATSAGNVPSNLFLSVSALSYPRVMKNRRPIETVSMSSTIAPAEDVGWLRVQFRGESGPVEPVAPLDPLAYNESNVNSYY